MKRAKAKKRGAEDEAAPPKKMAIMKRPRVALGGPSALARVSMAHLPRSLVGRDGDEVEVVHLLSEFEQIPSLG